MRVCLDIDGVLFPWADAANAAVVEKFGVADPGPHSYWTYLQDCITDEQWKWCWADEGSDATFGQIDRIYPEAKEAFTQMINEHEVHFVTHRNPQRTATFTAQFLCRHFGGQPWAGLHVLHRNTAKHDLLKWDVVIDDKPETAMDFLMNTAAQVFMPKRPWNQNFRDATEFVQGGERFVPYASPWEVIEWLSARVV